MIKTIKFKILTILDDKILLTLLIFFFIALNYKVFVDSGLLSYGGEDFNALLKYALLSNNFINIASFLGLIVAIYIGSGVIGKDIVNGQIYVIMSSYSKRIKYLLANWIALMIIIGSFVILILLNFISCSYITDVKLVYSDIVVCFRDIFLNMTVIMTVTAVFSICIKGIGSMVIGFVSLIIYNLFTFMKIPFIDLAINLDLSVRQKLFSLMPITLTGTPTLYNSGYMKRYDFINSGIIENISVYQVLYIFLILSIGTFVFKRKNL